MKSQLPKVLHNLGGKTLVERTLDSCHLIQPTRRFVIIGYQGQKVQDSLQAQTDLEFVPQTEQLGTGHAIQQLLPHLQGFEGDLLVLNGDVPLLRPESLEKLITIHKQNGNAATLLTAQVPDPTGYGRVFCAGDNLVTQIVEERDCNDAQRKNNRINAGVYCFNWPKLATVLPSLKSDNDQQEYYLTDVVKDIQPVMAVDVDDYLEISGINDRRQLAMAYDIFQARIKDFWMKEGVTMLDPDSITIDDTVKISPDVILEPQTHLRGNTAIASGCRLGPNTMVENSTLGENVRVTYSVISDSTVAAQTTVGPYSHLRGKAQVGEGCRIGNFVEVKNTTIGDRTNAAHLSYLGDATLGEGVNVGAGTITANYDGFQKHHSHIGAGSKTGANSVLVAPITLGENVTVGAGSVVTKDVETDALVVARGKQKVIPQWTSQQSPAS